MQCNMGTHDRIIRGAVGLIILFLGWRFDSLWGFIGLAPLFTAFLGWCPAYIALGFSTACKCEDE